MNKNKIIRFGAALCAATFAAAVLHAERPLASSFSEDTLLFLETRPLSELRERWPESPIGQLFQREDVQVFVKRMLGDMEADFAEKLVTDPDQLITRASEFLDLSEDEVRQLFSGRIAFGLSLADVTAISALMDDDAEDDEALRRLGLSGRFLLKHDGKKDLVEKALKNLHEKTKKPDEDAELETRDVGSFTLYESARERAEHERQFALVDDTRLVLSFGALDPSLVAREVEGREARAFADRSIYPIGEDAMDDPDVRMVGRLEILDAALREALPALMEDASQLIEAGILVPPDRLINLIRIDALQGFYYAMRADSETVSYVSGMEIEERGGLINSLLAYTDGQLPSLDFVPRDVTGVNALRYDVGAVLRAVDSLVPRISPLYGNMYEAYKGQLASESGVNLDHMLFDNFTDKVVLLVFEPSALELNRVAPGEPPPVTTQVQVFSVRDGNRIVEGVDRLTAAVGMDGMLQKDEYLGATLYTIPMMAAEGQRQQQGLAVTADRLVFATGDLSKLREVLTLMAEPNRDFTGQPGVRAYLDGLDRELIGFGYTDVRRALEGIAVGARVAGGMMGAETRGAQGPPSIPDLTGFPLILLSHAVKTRYGFRQEGVVQMREE